MADFNVLASIAPVERMAQQRQQNSLQERALNMREQQNQFNNQLALRQMGQADRRLDLQAQSVQRQIELETRAMAERLSAQELEEDIQNAQVLASALSSGDEAAFKAVLSRDPELSKNLAGFNFADPNARGQLMNIVPHTIRPLMEARDAKLAAEQEAGQPTTAMTTLQQRADAAGLQAGTPEYQAFMANGGKVQSGMELSVSPTGGVTFREGAIDDKPQAMSPSSPESMISSIDGILNDPALDTSVGLLSPLQNVPGTPMRRVGARIDQLDGQAFLQAFESLKGGGQITEIEGAKATQAIGRLDSAQSPADYRAALTELREILVLANGRPQGWAERAAQQLMAPEVGVVEDGFRFLGGDPSDQNSWEAVR